jgi:hypothetical protein
MLNIILPSGGVTKRPEVIGYVEGGERRGRAVTFLVVGHRTGAALLHRQTGLGAVERLDLALLIDREDDGMGGRIDIEARCHAACRQLRVGRELELFHLVRLKAVRTPDALDGAGADIDNLRHHGGGPMGRLCGRIVLGERHDALGDVRFQGRDARTPRLVAQEALITLLHEAFLPAPDTGLRFAGPAYNLIGANTIRAQQDDLSAPDMFVRHVRSRPRHFQTAAINGLKSDGNSGSHASGSLGIPSGIQMSDVNH